MKTATPLMIMAVFCIATLAISPSFAGESDEGGQNAEFYIRLGNTFMEGGQYEQALSMYEKASSLAPEVDLKESMARAHVSLADLLIRKDDPRPAA